MGAMTFIQEAKGMTAKEAFEVGVAQAGWDHGHSGYSGTLAEKTEFVMVDYPDTSIDVHGLIQNMLDDPGSPVYDKWGPAGCIDYAPGNYIFFGWASS